MRHKKKFNHLGRKRGHRKAMLSNMAASLIMNKRIMTTTAKAKALKIYVEPLITKAKEDSTNSRRQVFSYLQDKDAVSELFREVAVKVGERPGGYTRIIKLGNRLGDNADMCYIELVDFNENLLAEKAAAKKSASRRRRGAKKKTETSAAETPVAEVAAEKAPVEPVEEVVEETVSAEEAPVAEAAVEDSKAEEVPAEEPVAEEPKKEEPKAEAEETKEEPADEEETKE